MPVHNLEGRTLVFLVSEDWYFWSHRLPVARAARDAGARIVVASRFADHAGLIAAEGFECVPVPFDRSGLNPVHDIQTLWAIIRCYRTFRPDLVHHVAAKPILLGQIAARLAGVPRVVNAMTGMGFLYTAETRKAAILRTVFERTTRYCTARCESRIVVQNDDDAAIFARFGIPAEKIILIPGSGVDCIRFSPHPEPEGEIVAVCVSRMLRDKGIHELVEAARLLQARGVALRIRLVGGSDANPSSTAASQLDQWDTEGIVEVAGPSEDIPGEYARAHIAVLPSYREGLPKSLLEAAACGRPIVTTDVPGCRSICRDGENGFLVPPRDAAALADALMRLGQDAALRERMGDAGRKLVLENFSQDIIAGQTCALYEEMLCIG